MRNYDIDTFVDDEQIANWLHAEGLTSADEFLKKCGTAKQRDKRLQGASIDRPRLEYYLSIADLMRVQGIGASYARFLVGKDIRSIQDLLSYDQDELGQTLRSNISINDELVETWFASARELTYRIDCSTTHGGYVLEDRFSKELSAKGIVILGGSLFVLFALILVTLLYLTVDDFKSTLTGTQAQRIATPVLRTFAGYYGIYGIAIMASLVSGLLLSVFINDKIDIHLRNWFRQLLGPSFDSNLKEYHASMRKTGIRYYLVGMVIITSGTATLFYFPLTHAAHADDFQLFIRHPLTIIAAVFLAVSVTTLLGYPMYHFIHKQRQKNNPPETISAFATFNASKIIINTILLAIVLQLIYPLVISTGNLVLNQALTSYSQTYVPNVVQKLNEIEESSSNSTEVYHARRSKDIIQQLSNDTIPDLQQSLQTIPNWVTSISGYAILIYLFLRIILQFFAPLFLLRGRNQIKRTLAALSLSVVLPLLFKQGVAQTLTMISADGISLTSIPITIYTVVVVDEIKQLRHNPALHD